MPDLPLMLPSSESKQFLNPDEAPVIRHRVSAVNRAMTEAQAAAFQKGELEVPANVAPTAFATGAAQAPLPAAAPAPQALPTVPVASAPVPLEAPLQPSDGRKVRERIQALWGRARDAETQNQALQNQLNEMQNQLRGIAQARAPQQPEPNYGYQTPGYAQVQPPDSISRAELQAILEHERRQIGAQTALQNSHVLSRLEAERDFPDVFSDPDLQAAATELWNSDPFLQSDPRGPWKSALLVRGLRSDGRSYANPAVGVPVAGMSEEARKQVMSGIGPSVPQGTTTPPPSDLQQKYDEAMARYRQFNRPEDAARAFGLKLGLTR